MNELIEKEFFLKFQNLGRGVVRENGSLRTSGSSLLHKLEKIVRIIFKVMEINLQFAVIQRVVVQEKWLNLSNSNELIGN